MKHFMTQRWKAIKTHKSSLCQADTHKIQTYAPIPMERHTKFFGKQVTCLNVLQSKTTRSKSVGNQVGFILDAARESQSIRDHGVSCDVLEHIRQGVPKLWAWPGISCQISANIRLEIKCTINAMCLNHPETTSPSPGLWKNCLHEINSWAKNAEDC